MTNWSPDRQQAVQARCDKATKGPWDVCCEKKASPHVVADTPITKEWPSGGKDIPHDLADADFIAHARQDLPDALAEIAAKDAEIARLLSCVAQALNGWGAYARTATEFDDIARLRKESERG